MILAPVTSCCYPPSHHLYLQYTMLLLAFPY
jgi:hypothetical protein